MLDDSRPPSPDDSLFDSVDSDWWDETLLHWGGDGWVLYTIGYKEAADLLVEQAEVTPSRQGTLAYPILFLYRQYLELSIKYATGSARKLLREPGGYPRGHNISRLWQECQQVLARAVPDEPAGELNELSRLIEEFAAVDPVAQAFRYPIDSNGKATLSDLPKVNLKNVRDVMRSMALLLDGAGEQLAVYFRYQAEMDSEARP